MTRLSRRLLRIAALAFGVLFTVACIACCAMPDFASEFEGDGVVERVRVDADVGGEAYRLSVLRAGNPAGRRVVFVHGTPGRAEDFLGMLRRVPRDMQYVSLDRPGFGSTTPTHAVPSLGAQAEAVAALLDTRGGEKPILVGHSLGGPIVAEVAARYPDRIAGHVQLAGSLDPGLEETYWVQYLGEAPPFVWLLPRAIVNCNRELFALGGELAQLRDRLPRITTPVVVVHGTDDSLVPYANVDYMQQHMTNVPRLEIVRLKGGNHFLPWNAQSVIEDAIRSIDERTARGDADRRGRNERRRDDVPPGDDARRRGTDETDDTAPTNGG